ncbi:MAG: AI-2E family transporter, partial [Aestuariivirga sp.]
MSKMATEIEAFKPNSENFSVAQAGTFAIVATFGLYFGRDFLLPMTLALLIAFTFRPAIRYLSNHHIPPMLTATICLLAFVLGGLLLVYVLIDPINVWIADFPTYAKTFLGKIQTIRNSIDGFVALTDRFQSATSPTPNSALQEVVVRQSSVMSYIGQITGYSASVFTTAILALVTAGFLMASGDLFYAKLVHVLPSMADKKRALRIVYEVEREVSSYLLTVTAINAGLGLSVGVTFHILGMPMPYLWGLCVFFLNFIPYVGAAVGIGLSAFVAVATFDTLAFAALAPLAYLICNSVENQFVSPLFLGRRLQLNSVAILVSLAFWTWIWGLAGTMIAVPLLVTLKVFCDHME